MNGGRFAAVRVQRRPQSDRAAERRAIAQWKCSKSRYRQIRDIARVPAVGAVGAVDRAAPDADKVGGIGNRAVPMLFSEAAEFVHLVPVLTERILEDLHLPRHTQGQDRARSAAKGPMRASQPSERFALPSWAGHTRL